ncbi:phage major capsid protein [Romboutsia sedimentorum]|uniref:phage major capsid protein n=1 Tax=Romboutsia sedimentorum TaxID=1368474 RepID=UPI0024DE09F0|nr:phage major capsid protein [Romboutsia sedimentorum]MDK2587480.1 phage major capsid protein [Romboutsia sedimentorum]
MKLKQLQEKRSAVISEMQEMTETTEKRGFDEELFATKEAEIKGIDAEIRALEKVQKLIKVENKNEERKGEDNMELRKDIMDGKEVKLEERSITNATDTTTAKDLIQTDYASEIFKGMEYISPLFGQVRKIVTSSMLNIPVAKGKLGKFVKTAELGDYVANKSNFDTVSLGAEKYTNLVILSQEVLDDNDYNLEKEMKDQLVESFAITMDELIVKGDGALAEGLNSFVTNKVVQSASGTITTDEIIDLFFKLPIQYRQNSSWVLNDDTAKVLTKLRDTQDRPLLVESFNDDAFGATYKLMGRPVIINNNVDKLGDGAGKKAIFLANLDQAMVVGLRKNLTIQKDTSVLFLQDGVAIKANARLDSKKLNESSVVFLECK